METAVNSKTSFNFSFEKSFFPTRIRFIFYLKTENCVLLVKISQMQIIYFSKTKMHKSMLFQSKMTR